MTRNNSTYPEIAAQALERAYDQLGKLMSHQFCEEGTMTLLSCIQTLEYLNTTWADDTSFAEDTVFKPVSDEKSDVVSDEKSDVVSDEAPTPAPAPDPAPDSEPEGEYMKKEEVRSRLATLQDKHPKLDIAGIMSAMGYQKLSAIPASRYQELLDKAEQAAKEIG